MRVIAGRAKGRILQAPKGLATRPTPSRVREALFSMVAAWLPQAHVLDLYAGSGALGIEALSRGAAHCVFVEQAAQALIALRTNLASASLPDTAEVLAVDVDAALSRLSAAGRTFDLVLMDPPYALNRVGPTVQALAAHKLLRHDGLIVAEHAGAQQSPEPPPAWARRTHRRWGDVAVSLYVQAPISSSPRKEPP